MRHVLLENWSRRTSVLHRRDPRAKALALAIFLVVIATAHAALLALAAGSLLLLAAGIVSARLPLGQALLRACAVLWFAGTFALLSWAAGEPARALALLLKSYISALAVLLLVGTTPVPALLDGLERMGAPVFLLMVAQFLYRYLFVIFEEAGVMRQASTSRGGASFRAAAGALAALFARAYSRAEEIHRAMLARGFTGEFATLAPPRFRAADGLFLLAAGAAPVLLRAAVERAA